ncbi:MAG: carboxypeptidase regulatory-like domain-containing protein [Deltaproteobacteria bacterium]|nr:carboxypeptidase regulatory-like domain-containing protein [Deltaproteobacteria bacterium]
MDHPIVRVAALSLCLAVGACDGKPKSDAPPPASAPAGAPATPGAAATTGTLPGLTGGGSTTLTIGDPNAPKGKTGTAKIMGHVKWTGPAPEERAAPVTFPECKDRKPIPAMKVAADGGLANVFVYVQSGLPAGAYDLPPDPVDLHQKDCEYLPRVFGIRAGQPLIMHNDDPMLHNVHARGQGAGMSTGPNSFNVAMPVQNTRLMRKFDEPQVAVTIVCDVHPWMRSYAGVVANPFWAVTKDDGSFAIEGLPAGTYTLEFWHERQGKKTAQVTVTDGQAATVDLAFAP